MKTPADLLQDSASCIELFFANQTQLVMESGVHNSLCSTCHQQIVLAKLNLKVEYPPPYELLFWNYSRADKTSINRSINTWKELFSNKTVESQVS